MNGTLLTRKKFKLFSAPKTLGIKTNSISIPARKMYKEVKVTVYPGVLAKINWWFIQRESGVMLPGQLYLSLSRVPAWRGGLEKIKEVLFPLQFTVPNPVLGFPGGSDGKESASNMGDLGSILGSGRSPGEGNGNPLQCSYLQNPVARGALWATVHGITKSWTWLSD